MKPLQRHFFVCVSERPPESPKPSCGRRNAFEILMAFRGAMERHPELWADVKVTQSGCLGPCESGPSIVVYPEGFWYGQVTMKDVQEIIDQHLVNGKPVERLRLAV